MPGVAYTKGSELDDDHKEIHFSMRHIVNSKQRAKDEITGVIVHEMVHCFQCNGKGSCPGGLIEGIAGKLVPLFLSPALLSRRHRLRAIKSRAFATALAEGRQQVGRRLPNHRILLRLGEFSSSLLQGA